MFGYICHGNVAVQNNFSQHISHIYLIGCDSVQIRTLLDSDNFLQMRNPTDFQTHSELNLHSSFVLESACSSFVTICRKSYKSKQIHTE